MQGKDPFLALLGLFILSTTFFFCGKGLVTSPPPAAVENPTTSPPQTPSSSELLPSSPPAPPASGPTGFNKTMDERLIGQPIVFGANGATLLPNGEAVLNDLATMLRDDSTRVFDIGRYIDSVELEQMNPSLSEQRSRVVVAYLVAKGIAVERLTPKGLEPSRLVAERTTDAGPWQSHTVELSIDTKGVQP